MPELDPIVQDIIANATQFVDEIDEAAKAVAEAAKAVSDLESTVRDLRTALDAAALAARDAARATDSLATKLYAASTRAWALGQGIDKATDASDKLFRSLLVLDAELEQKKEALGGLTFDMAAMALTMRSLSATVASLSARMAASNAITNTANNGIRLWGLGFGLTNVAIHGIISGIIEFLAVLIPAMVAAGAWAAVWSEGVQSVTQHMQALQTATEATQNVFHTTIGDVLGLGHALQAAQTAARPDVYQALGATIDILKSHFSNLAATGLAVGKIFDQFLGKVAYDFSSAGDAAGKLNTLASGMIPAIVGLGQVFGNLGHALLNLSAAMPGLAFVLLRIADAVSSLILRFSQLPTWIIYGIFALHEFNTWGSVIVSLLSRMGLEVTAVSGSFFGFGRATGVFMNLFRFVAMIIPNVISLLGVLLVSIGRIIPGLAAAGGAAQLFAARLAGALDTIGPLRAALIVLAAAAVGFLIYKMVTATSAAQQFVDQLQKGIQAASNWQVLNVIGSAISQMQNQLTLATQAVARYDVAMTGGADATGQLGTANRMIVGALAQAHESIATFTMGLDQAAGQVAVVTRNAQILAATYHTTIPGAIALASQANVSLTSELYRSNGALTAQGQQIRALVQGYQAMGAPLGAVGNDMSYLAIQSGLASTKVSQLNQAFSEFMTNLTGGTSGLANYTQALSNITTVAATVSNNLSNATGSITLTTGQFANALKNFSGAGATAWQNFDQVVGSTAPQLINWLRTAGAEGAIAGPEFQKAILDMLAPLVPLASKSKAAQTELMGLLSAAGLNIKTFPELVAAIKRTHANVDDLGKIIDGVTTKMGDMGAVAQQLGNIMNSALAQAISDASLKASGFYTATAALTTALQKYGANSPQAVAAAAAVTRAWDKAQAMAAQVAQQAHNAQNAIDNMHGKTLQIITQFINQGMPASAAAAAGSHVSGGGTVYGHPADAGAMLPPGMSLIANNTGGFEAILTPGQVGTLLKMGTVAGAAAAVFQGGFFPGFPMVRPRGHPGPGVEATYPGFPMLGPHATPGQTLTLTADAITGEIRQLRQRLTQELRALHTYELHHHGHVSKKIEEEIKKTREEIKKAQQELIRVRQELERWRQLQYLLHHPSTSGPSGLGSPSWQTWRAYEAPGGFGGGQRGRRGGSVEYPGYPVIFVHVHGSTFGTMQDITRAVQTGLNQKTLRNGSTQTFIAGRKH